MADQSDPKDGVNSTDDLPTNPPAEPMPKPNQ